MSIEQLTQEPALFDFYQAVYLVERQLSPEDKEWLGVGMDSFPSKEVVRFKSAQHLGFPGMPISKAEISGQEENLTSVNMHVSFMGLTGPSGILPRHYSELLLRCIKNRDTAMRDFFDLFNHRLISLNYRAWKKYRMATHYEQGGSSLSDAYSKVLVALTGGENTLHIHYGGLFNKSNRSAEGLRCMLKDLLGCSVEVQELQGKWISLSEKDQTKLSSCENPEGQFSRLGCEATLGGKVWDISSAIEVVITPHTSAQIKNLRPGTKLHQGIKDLITNYVDSGIQVKLKLQTKLKDLPRSELGCGNVSLGQSARLSHRPDQNQQFITI